MRKIRGRIDVPPEHGPVRRITDPGVLQELAARYARGTEPRAAEPRGNVISFSLDGKQQTVSDREIARTLEADLQRPEEERMPKKHRRTLRDFGWKLSRDGPRSFTDAQTMYLATLMGIAQDPAAGRFTPEEKTEKRLKICAFHAYRRARVRENEKAIFQAVQDFFFPETLAPVIAQVAGVLKPYSLEAEAKAFVLNAGWRVLHGLDRTIELEAERRPRSERSRVLWHWIGPGSRSSQLDDLERLCGELRREIAELPAEASATVIEKMALITKPERGRIGVTGGSPELGKRA